MSQNTLKLGVLTVLFGPYASMGEDGLRGVDLAVTEFGGQVAGKRIQIVKAGSNAIPDSAMSETELLLDKHGVDFVIGPLSGDEGIAMRDFAKTRPHLTFINGIAGAQDMTLRNPSPNFFNFFTNGVQWMAGLPQYVYEVLGYRKVVTLAEDYSYPHGQVAGFTIQFCRLGGKVLQKFWVALGKSEYSEVIAAMPADIDAIFCCVGGTDAVAFLKQYGGKTPLIAGSITIDQTILSTRGELADRLVGTASSGPIADDDPSDSWQSFAQSYRKRFPLALSSPSLTAYGYYVNTKAALLALKSVEGDLSDGQAKFQAALRALAFDAPTGPVKLDHNRQAIATNFVTVVDKRPDGTLYNRLVRTTPAVNQTLGVDEDEYLKIGIFSKTNPPVCP